VADPAILPAPDGKKMAQNEVRRLEIRHIMGYYPAT
jgi:hypothetical protein